MDIYEIITSFKKYFPLLSEEFENNKKELKPHQLETIRNIFENGNTLCIMPTGGGKSLIYWLAGMMTGGITIVVSPLISLIDEQAEKLQEQNIEILALHGSMGIEKQVSLLKKFANREINPKFIFASPEKLATDGFFEYCIRVRKSEIKMIAIDEVHCVSQWGASFRPFYRNIPNFINNIFIEEKPKTLAMTATINPKELSDICIEFNIDKKNIIKNQSLMRSEITLKVIKLNNEKEKDDDGCGKLWDLLKIHNEKTLVYVYRKYRKRGVEELSERANEKHGINSICFHGDMDSKERKAIISKFKNNEINVVFATNAFGMGIDIPDVRVVIHFMLPESVEQYYQEIGRAARDAKAANTYVLYTDKNVDIKRTYFIDDSFPKREELINVFKKIPKSKTEVQTLPYFDDEEIQKCLHYYVDCGAVEIICKGFTDFTAITNTNEKELTKIINSSITKSLISSSKKSGVSVPEIIEMVYGGIINGNVETKKPLDRRLIIKVNNNELSESQLDKIMEAIEQKKKYKHDLLDYFIFLLDNNVSSVELHQEIARYLGVDKDMLDKIYSTSKGDKVRSKSEVIIANLLFEHSIEYVYELPLLYEPNKQIKPDFTIILPDGRKLYWEHLGMLGSENYDNTWLYKMKIYEKYYRGQLEKTYEGVTITDSVLDLIKRIKLM